MIGHMKDARAAKILWDVVEGLDEALAGAAKRLDRLKNLPEPEDVAAARRGDHKAAVALSEAGQFPDEKEDPEFWQWRSVSHCAKDVQERAAEAAQAAIAAAGFRGRGSPEGLPGRPRALHEAAKLSDLLKAQADGVDIENDERIPRTGTIRLTMDEHYRLGALARKSTERATPC